MATDDPGFDPRYPFTRAAAEAAGLTWRYLQGPRCQKIMHNVYLDADVPQTAAMHARAAMLVVPGAVAACHLTAAEILQLPVPCCSVTHVLVPLDHPRVRRREIVVHHGERRLSRRDGVSITTALETFGDVAPDIELVDAVALGDAIVHEGYATVTALRRRAEQLDGRARTRAMAAAELVRPRVRLPQETRLRLLMTFSGLPEPVTGLEITASGRRRELDTAYPEWRVAVEYDGRHHVERDLYWSDDIERHEQIRDEEWTVVTVTGLQLWDPERVLGRIRAALTKAGAQLSPVDQRWRRHFPSRRRPSS